MKKINVRIKISNGVLEALCNSSYRIHICGSDIKKLKELVEKRVLRIYEMKLDEYKKTEQYEEPEEYYKNKPVIPQITYTYEIREILHEIKPFIKINKIAEYSGLSTIMISSYMNNKKNISEESFLKIRRGIRKILLEMNLKMGL